MLHFKLGVDISKKSRPKKASIFFNALHHSREPTSLSTLMAVVFDTLKDLYNKQPLYNFFDVDVVPIVNIDGYRYINRAYGKKSWTSACMIRKNRNLTKSPCGSDKNSGGVDINRNYGYQWGYKKSIDGSSANPCQSDFRGTAPFSEPETRSMKNFIETNPQVKSAMNFHAWGDLFIYPYNYVADPTNQLL